MRMRHVWSVGVVVLVGTWRVWAQDPLVVAPGMYRLLKENDRVRVMEVTFQPGQVIAEHAHPDHFVYVVEGGQLRISKPGQADLNADLQVGQVLWIPAETHSARNTGESVVRLLVTELKEPAPVAVAPPAPPAPAPPAP